VHAQVTTGSAEVDAAVKAAVARATADLEARLVDLHAELEHALTALRDDMKVRL